MKKNIAVVGCGHWGKNLVRNFHVLGALNSVSDPNQEIASKFSKLYGVNELSFPKILADKTIEGVVLAVPAELHAKMAIEAMDSGKHVYVEKPLALNNDDAIKMLKKSKEMNVKLMVGHLLQYHPGFIEARKIISKGELGDLYYIYSNRLSFGKVRKQEDVIWSFAPHDISMILSLSDHKPIEVTTNCSYLLQKSIADKAIININFDSGLRAHINLSWLNPYKEQKIVMIGSSGSLIFDDTLSWDKKLALYPHKIDVSKELPDLNQSKPKYIHLDESEPLNNECNHFLDVVNHGLKPLTDGEEGFSVLKILTAAKLSQTHSKSVKI